jgi:hypothetical protein
VEGDVNEEILKRIEAALDRLEEIEHRVGTVIEGNRMQLSTLAEDLKLRELRHELRNLCMAIRETPA